MFHLNSEIRGGGGENVQAWEDTAVAACSNFSKIIRKYLAQFETDVVVTTAAINNVDQCSLIVDKALMILLRLL